MSQPGGGGGENKMGMPWGADNFFDFHIAMYA